MPPRKKTKPGLGTIVTSTSRKSTAGRPRHVYSRSTSRTHNPSPTPTVNETQAPELPSAASSDDNHAPSGESVSPDTRARYEMIQDGLVVPVLDSSPVQTRVESLGRLKLNTLLRNDTWQQVATEDLLDLPYWFEKHFNDFIVKEYLITNSVLLEFIDDPGDDSKDIRARRVRIRQDPAVPEKAWERLVKDNAVVYRAVYNCARACQRVIGANAAQEPTLEEIDLDDLDTNSSPPKKPTGRKRKHSHVEDARCPVNLHVEVTARHLNEVTVWQQHEHKDASAAALQWSRRLRLQAIILSRREGATAGQVMKSLLQFLHQKTGKGAVPDHRKPTRQDIENIMPASRRKQHYARNAFASLSIFAEQNSDRVFIYHPCQATGPSVKPSKLLCGVTDEFCLSSALLYAADNGTFMDATWRGMNQNYAPTTFLLGVDDKGHATPFAVLLSQDVQAETLAQFLSAWVQKLKSHAQQVLTKAPSFAGRTPEEIKAIQAQAQQLVKGKWAPAFFMIDKDQAERNACKNVFPNVEVRVCQFHVMDAIQRWLNVAHPTTETRPKKKGQTRKTFIVPKEAHPAIENAFRLTQQCRIATEWQTYLHGFDAAITHICSEHGIAEYSSKVLQYFEDNFWCDDWRESITDVGLPPGRTRDKILNTNNHAESFIKTFKYTIHGMRRNKRIDTLVIILADMMLPYYQMWRDNRIKHTKDHLDTTQHGYDLWQHGTIQKIGTKKFHVDDTNSRRYQVTWGDKPSCVCSRFAHTGKMCHHLWAVKLFVQNGSFMQWAEKALPVKELYSAGLENDDDFIPVDENFPNIVKSWEQAGDTLHAHSAQGLSAFLLGAISEAAETSEHSLPSPQHPSSPIAVQLAPPTTKGATEFTPNVVDKGGRVQKPSPIRKWTRTRPAPTSPTSSSDATSGAQSPSRSCKPSIHPNPTAIILCSSPPPTKTVFRRYKSSTAQPAKAQRRIEPKTKPSTHAHAAALDNESALVDEDFNLRIVQLDSWHDPQYQLRYEEGFRIADMLTSLSSTLGLGTLVIADQGDSIKFQMNRILYHEVTTLSGLVASFSPDNLINQIISRSPGPSALKGVAFLRLRNSHWKLFHFKVDTHVLTVIDSIPEAWGHDTLIDEVDEYSILVDYLSTPDPQPVNIMRKWDVSNIFTGHQPVESSSGLVINQSCGFWATFYAITALFETPIKTQYALNNIVSPLLNIVKDYETSRLGGLSRHVMLNSYSSLVPNLRVRLLQFMHKDVWAPHLHGQDDPLAPVQPSSHAQADSLSTARPVKTTVINDTAPPEVPQIPVTLTGSAKPKSVQHDEQILIDAAFRKTALQVTYRIAGWSISHTHFQTLAPQSWISSAILDLLSHIFSSVEERIWCHTTAFMPLLKESYLRVSRILPYHKKLKTSTSIFNDVSRIFIPFNEPLKSINELPPADDKLTGLPGSHWASITIYPEQKVVKYKSSLIDPTEARLALNLVKVYLKTLNSNRTADKGRYRESEWTFKMIMTKPQQTNSYNCGIFVVSYLLECVLGLDFNWGESDIATLRARLASQILKKELTAHSLVEPNTALVAHPAEYVSVTPHANRKHRMSATPSVSPELHRLGNRKEGLPARTTQPVAKKAKHAPFPMKPSFSEVVKGMKPQHTQIAAPDVSNLKLKDDSDDERAAGNSLCPFCDEPIPTLLQARFDQQLEKYNPISKPVKRAGNNRARVAKTGKNVEVHGLCVWHRKEGRITTQPKSMAWPDRIERANIPNQMQTVLPHLQSLAMDPTNSQIFQDACAFWTKKGRASSIKPIGIAEAAGIWGKSYYGDAGEEVIVPLVLELIRTQALTINWESWKPIHNERFALDAVLIPEVICCLVMDDMSIGQEEALKVMEESREFGEAGNSIVV